MQYINAWCCSVYNQTIKNQLKKISQQSTPAGPNLPAQPADLPISLLGIMDGIHPNLDPQPRPTPQVDYEVDGLLYRQTHGQDMRRLLKMVCEAILNPCECKGAMDTILIQTFLQVYIDWDVENNIMQNVSRVEQINMQRTGTDSPAPHLGVTAVL